MNTTVPTTAQVADRLERTARLIAPAVAFAITAAVLMTQLAYELGFQLGQAVHARNNQLSALWVRLWAPAPEAEAEAPAPVVLAEPPAAPIPAALAPLQHPLMTLAAELEQLTRRELQVITGCRSKLAKAQLVSLALAMA